MSIQRKLFLLILAGCGLSLLFLVGPLLYGMTGLYEAIDTKGNNLAQLVSAYTTAIASLDRRPRFFKLFTTIIPKAKPAIASIVL